MILFNPVMCFYYNDVLTFEASSLLFSHSQVSIACRHPHSELTGSLSSCKTIRASPLFIIKDDQLIYCTYIIIIWNKDFRSNDLHTCMLC